MSEFKDLTSDAGLSELNKHLSTRSYIDGFKPSHADNNVLAKIFAQVNANKYPHVDRWLRHVTSFCVNVRSQWSGKAAGNEEEKKSVAGAPGGPTKAAGKGKPKAPVAEEEEADDDFAMNLSDDEGDDDAQALIAKKAQEKEAAKKATKSNKDISKMAKSMLILDVKPEDNETDLGSVEKQIRAISMAGLTWGEAQRIPVAFGIKKIRIGCVVVDGLVSTDDLQEGIEAIDGVQSTDVHAFNKM
jgi:elongation factor 1-beta